MLREEICNFSMNMDSRDKSHFVYSSSELENLREHPLSMIAPSSLSNEFFNSDGYWDVLKWHEASVESENSIKKESSPQNATEKEWTFKEKVFVRSTKDFSNWNAPSNEVYDRKGRANECSSKNTKGSKHRKSKPAENRNAAVKKNSKGFKSDSHSSSRDILQSINNVIGAEEQQPEWFDEDENDMNDEFDFAKTNLEELKKAYNKEADEELGKQGASSPLPPSLTKLLPSENSKPSEAFDINDFFRGLDDEIETANDDSMRGSRFSSLFTRNAQETEMSASGAPTEKFLTVGDLESGCTQRRSSESGDMTAFNNLVNKLKISNNAPVGNVTQPNPPNQWNHNNRPNLDSTQKMINAAVLNQLQFHTLQNMRQEPASQSNSSALHFTPTAVMRNMQSVSQPQQQQKSDNATESRQLSDELHSSNFPNLMFPPPPGLGLRPNPIGTLPNNGLQQQQQNQLIRSLLAAQSVSGQYLPFLSSTGGYIPRRAPFPGAAPLLLPQIQAQILLNNRLLAANFAAQKIQQMQQQQNSATVSSSTPTTQTTTDTPDPFIICPNEDRLSQSNATDSFSNSSA